MLLSERPEEVEVCLRLPGGRDQVARVRSGFRGTRGGPSATRRWCAAREPDRGQRHRAHVYGGAGLTLSLTLSYLREWVLPRIRDEGSPRSLRACHITSGITVGTAADATFRAWRAAGGGTVAEASPASSGPVKSGSSSRAGPGF